MITCKDPFFSVPAYAAPVSGIAATVGAVTLAAIALRLGTPPVAERDAREALRNGSITPQQLQAMTAGLSRPLFAMPIAFVASLIAAYGFAGMAGLHDCAVAAELGYFVGGQLGLAAALLLFAICWLLRDYEVHSHAVRNAKTLSWGVGIVVLGFLSVSSSDYYEGLTGSQAPFSVWFPILLGLALPFVGGGAVALLMRLIRLTAGGVYERFRLHLVEPNFVQFIMVWLLVTLAGGVIATVALNQDPPVQIPAQAWVGYACMESTCLLLLQLSLPYGTSRTLATRKNQ